MLASKLSLTAAAAARGASSVRRAPLGAGTSRLTAGVGAGGGPVGIARAAAGWRSCSSRGPDDEWFMGGELGKGAAEARMRRQMRESRDIDVVHDQQKLCLAGVRGQSFEYSTLQAHVFGGNSKIPALAARHPSPPTLAHTTMPPPIPLHPPPPPPQPAHEAAGVQERAPELDQVLDQRLWLHEKSPTMEFSAECTRLAFGEQWVRHEEMLERASELRREIEQQEAKQIEDGYKRLREETRGGTRRLHARMAAEEGGGEAPEEAGASAVPRASATTGGVRMRGMLRPAAARGLSAPTLGGMGGGLLLSSVLKKRRKKMNKHKHKKRAKRDRGYGKA